MDLSDFVLSLQLIPELRLSENFILGEDSHSVQSGIGVLLRGVLSSHNPELSHLLKINKGLKRITFICMESTPTPLTISIDINK